MRVDANRLLCARQKARGPASGAPGSLETMGEFVALWLAVAGFVLSVSSSDILPDVRGEPGIGLSGVGAYDGSSWDDSTSDGGAAMTPSIPAAAFPLDEAASTAAVGAAAVLELAASVHAASASTAGASAAASPNIFTTSMVRERDLPSDESMANCAEEARHRGCRSKSRDQLASGEAACSASGSGEAKLGAANGPSVG